MYSRYHSKTCEETDAPHFILSIASLVTDTVFLESHASELQPCGFSKGYFNITCKQTLSALVLSKDTHHIKSRDDKLFATC